MKLPAHDERGYGWGRRVPWLLAAAMMLVLGLLGLRAAMSTAHANDIDDSYLGSLAAAGIKYRSPDGAIRAGHRVCQLLDQGKTKRQVAVTVMIRNICPSSCAMDPRRAGYFVGASVAAYCPRYMS